MLNKVSSGTPVEYLQEQGKHWNHQDHQGLGLILDDGVKTDLIIFESNASRADRPVHLRTRVIAIWKLLSVNVQWSAQGIEPGVRLHEKENDVTEEEQLEGL